MSWWLWHGAYEPSSVAAVATLLLWVAAVADAPSRFAMQVCAPARTTSTDSAFPVTRAASSAGYPPVQAGWFPDPQNRCQIRYFDGALWTQHVVWR